MDQLNGTDNYKNNISPLFARLLFVVLLLLILLILFKGLLIVFILLY